MEVKKAKNAKLLKISQLFLAFFGQVTGYSGTKTYTIGRNIIIYPCYFIKFALSKKKMKLKIVTATTTLTVPWSGLRRRQKD